MPLRTFTDETGREWRVWDTRPESRADERRFAENARVVADAPTDGSTGRSELRQRLSYSEGLEHGWLTFESGDAKRRLSPIPDGWSGAPDDALRRWCSEAHAVTRRLGTPGFPDPTRA